MSCHDNPLYDFMGGPCRSDLPCCPTGADPRSVTGLRPEVCLAPGPIKRPLKEGFMGERLWGVTVSVFEKILLWGQVKLSLTTKNPINRDGGVIHKSLVGPMNSKLLFLEHKIQRDASDILRNISLKHRSSNKRQVFMAVQWSPEQHVLTSGHQSLGHKHPVCVCVLLLVLSSPRCSSVISNCSQLHYCVPFLSAWG